MDLKKGTCDFHLRSHEELAAPGGGLYFGGNRMAYSICYEVTLLPNLGLNKYQSFADSGVDGMLQAQTQLLRQLHDVSVICNVSVHFFVDYDPERTEGHRIRIFLAFISLQGSDSNWDKIRRFMKASPLSRYFFMKEISSALFPQARFHCFMTLHKSERFLQSVINESVVKLYVVPGWEMSEQGRLYNLLKLMEAFEEPCVYRVDLYAEKDMEQTIHKHFEKPLMALRNISQSSNGLSELSRIHKDKRDPNTDETLDQYEEWLKKIDSSQPFLCRICTLTNDADYGKLLLNSAITESVSSGRCMIKESKTDNEAFHFLYNITDRKPLGGSKNVPQSMQYWTNTFTVEEAAPFMRFPVLYDGETIELPKETDPQSLSGGMLLGKDTHAHKVFLPDKLLAKHMFVCGVPGSGKTNTMLHLANSLWHHVVVKEKEEVPDPIPFLVLEPAKKEYRELALFDIPELILMSPAANTKFPMRLNPFEFPIGLTLSEHIGNLCQVFEGAFPIAPPAPFILDRAIQGVYESHGWNTSEINDGTKPYPTMSELYHQFEKEMEQTHYDSEVQGNIRSVLEMRIGSLLRRERKDIFDVRNSMLRPEEWMQRPVIVELEALGEGPANFVTLLLCTLIRETLKANPFKDKEKPVRHVIFIEEAHNLIAPQAGNGDPSESNPKIAATAYIVKMLAEVRALREGIVIADQLPTAMAPEVIKNTNIKLVHRLTSQDDRELIGSSMSANALQVESLGTFTSGQALISYEKLLQPFEMQVALVPEHGDQTPNDSELAALMHERDAYRFVIERTEAEQKYQDLKNGLVRISQLEQKRALELAVTDVSGMTQEQIQLVVNSAEEFLEMICETGRTISRKSEQLSEKYISPEKKKLMGEMGLQVGTGYRKRLETLKKKVLL